MCACGGVGYLKDNQKDSTVTKLFSVLCAGTQYRAQGSMKKKIYVLIDPTVQE